jgi:hypothetical protein
MDQFRGAAHMGTDGHVDAEGHIVGQEILDAAERLGAEQLLSITLQDLASGRSSVASLALRN